VPISADGNPEFSQALWQALQNTLKCRRSAENKISGNRKKPSLPAINIVYL
jgi:hypothetical protein